MEIQALDSVTKVADGGELEEMRSWNSDTTDVRHDDAIGQEVSEFIGKNGVTSVATSGWIIGCPHQRGIYYNADWYPVCGFWKGRDR